MTKQFYFTLAVLLFMIVFMAVHYLHFDRKRVAMSVDSLVALSAHSSLSLSRAWYETGDIFTDAAGNVAYPEMMPIERADFVYER
jgi:hypothetical protein